MTKVFKIIFGIILGLIVLSLVGTAAVGITAYDDRNILNEETKNDERSTKVILNTFLQKSLANVETTKEAELLLDCETIDHLVYSTIKAIDIPIGILTLTGSNVTCVNGSYIFKASANLSGYQSVLEGKIKLEYTNETFILNIEDLRLGKIDLYGIGKFILTFTNEKKIEKNLAKEHIYADIDLSHTKISVTKQNIQQMIEDLISEDDSAELMELLVDIFVGNEDILTFNLGINDLLGIVLHVQNLQYDESTHHTLPYSYDFETLANDVKTLLDNEKITLEDVDLVYLFLVKGYDGLEQKDEDGNVDTTKQDKIKTFDLSSIGISKVENYKGVITKTDETLKELLIGELLANPISYSLLKGFDIKITQEMLNTILKNLSFVGFSYAFANDETNEVGYLTIEQLDIFLDLNKITIDIIINLNNVQIYLEVVLNATEADGLTLDANVTNVSIGTNQLSEDQIKQLLSFLKGAVKELEWINVDVENKKLILNFEEIVQNDSINTIKKLFSAVTMKNKTSIKDGYININYYY